MRRNRMYWILPIICLAPVALAGFGFFTMWLWNALIPDLFHGPVINFWQTVGLLILTRILFSNFGNRHWGGHHRWKKEMWRRRWEEKMNAMPPEEREKFSRDYCCGPSDWCSPSRSKEEKTETGS